MNLINSNIIIIYMILRVFFLISLVICFFFINTTRELVFLYKDAKEVRNCFLNICESFKKIFKNILSIILMKLKKSLLN